jgi:dTDP-4-dehydrorhamnose 3,5-epimerase
VPHGRAIICAVEIDHPTEPSKENPVHRFVLDGDEPAILHIPGGYANGTRSITPGTKIIFFSTASVDESKGDDYRFPHDYWGMDHWKLD